MIYLTWISQNPPRWQAPRITDAVINECETGVGSVLAMTSERLITASYVGFCAAQISTSAPFTPPPTGLPSQILCG